MNTSQDEQIMNFMQITECHDFNQAKNYMTMAEFNLENAVSLYMELEPHGPTNNTRISQSVRTNQSFSNEEYKHQQPFTSMYNHQSNNRNQGPRPRPSQEVINQYRQFLTEKSQQQGSFFKKVINASISTFSRLIFSKQTNYGAEFYECLTQNKITTQIQFVMGNFDENLDKSQKLFKPLIIYVHSSEPNQYVAPFLNNSQLAAFLNKMYYAIGFRIDSQAIQDIKLKGINLEKPFTFYIIRMNLFEKPELIHQFEISPQIVMENLIGELKRIKADYNLQYIQDEEVRKIVKENDNPWAQQDIQQEPLQQPQPPPRNNNNNSLNSQIHNSFQQAQQQKLQEERALRQQQQEALKIAEEENRKIIQKREEEARKVREAEEAQKRQHEDRLFKKAQLMSTLPNEPSDDNPDKIEFLFRMPNGSKIERKFYSNDSIQILFDFVACQNEDCFETPDQDFDLIQNFPRLSLFEEKNKKIHEIFQESQMEQLIVKEL